MEKIHFIKNINRTTKSGLAIIREGVELICVFNNHEMGEKHGAKIATAVNSHEELKNLAQYIVDSMTDLSQNRNLTIYESALFGAAEKALKNI